jgi:hypothetical protein
MAREFAERYINESGVLDVVELHDEAYKAHRLMTQQEDQEAAERRASKLIGQLGDNLGLFLRFYLCDNQVGGKSAAHYLWFRGLVERHMNGNSRDEPSWNTFRWTDSSIDLGAVECGMHCLRFESRGQAHGVPDPDVFELSFDSIAD